MEKCLIMTPEQQQLVKDNLNLVPFIFKRYIKLNRYNYSWKQDIIQQGYLGLCYAAIHYKGQVRFSTYASLAIERQMLNLINSLRKNYMTTSLDFDLYDLEEETLKNKSFLNYIFIELDIEEEIDRKDKISFIKDIASVAPEKTQNLIYYLLNNIKWSGTDKFKDCSRQSINKIYHTFINKCISIFKFSRYSSEFPKREYYSSEEDYKKDLKRLYNSKCLDNFQRNKEKKPIKFSEIKNIKGKKRYIYTNRYKNSYIKRRELLTEKIKNIYKEYNQPIKISYIRKILESQNIKSTDYMIRSIVKNIDID